LVNFDAENFIYVASINYHINVQMNSTFTKVSNLKVNRVSKIAITLASSTFFLYALGQAPIFKNILAGAFSCSG
jgi:hypothetical protein